jgi:hypothetical protein
MSLAVAQALLDAGAEQLLIREDACLHDHCLLGRRFR